VDWGAAGWATPQVAGLSGRSGQVGGDDVGGVTVEGSPGPVVAHGRSGVSMRRCLLDVAEGDSSVECCGDERVPQGVGCDPLVDPCPLGQPADDPGGGMTIETGGGIAVQQDRASLRSTMHRSMARPVRGARGMVTMAPPFRVTVTVR